MKLMTPRQQRELLMETQAIGVDVTGLLREIAALKEALVKALECPSLCNECAFEGEKLLGRKDW